MLKDVFALWLKQSDLMKLQYAYGTIVVITLVAAGLVGLLNQNVSWQILSVTGIATITFFVNLISFALVNLLAEQQPKPVRRATKTARRSTRR